MAKAKAKSKPCAKAKCKGKGLGKGKGRGKGKGLGTGTSLLGLARRQAVARKRKAQVLEEIPGPTVEQDPLVAELKLELESQLLDIHVDEAREADPAPSVPPMPLPVNMLYWNSRLPCRLQVLLKNFPRHVLRNQSNMVLPDLCLPELMLMPKSHRRLHRRQQQCRHSHPLRPCPIQCPGRGKLEWHSPLPPADQPLCRALILLLRIMGPRPLNVVHASMVHT